MANVNTKDIDFSRKILIRDYKNVISCNVQLINLLRADIEKNRGKSSLIREHSRVIGYLNNINIKAMENKELEAKMEELQERIEELEEAR